MNRDWLGGGVECQARPQTGTNGDKGNERKNPSGHRIGPTTAKLGH